MKQKFQYSETHYGAAPCRPDVHGVLIKGKRGRLLSVLYTAAGEHSETLRLKARPQVLPRSRCCASVHRSTSTRRRS